MGIVQLVTAGLTTGMVYALVALGYHLIYRATRVIDFAQGEKVAIGGLIALSAMQLLGVNLIISLLVAILVGYMVGWVYERGIIRHTYHRPEVVAIIATVGFSQFLEHGKEILWGHRAIPFPFHLGGQERMLHIFGVRILEQHLWVWALVIMVVILLHLYFERTMAGQAMIAAAENELGARLVGIDVGGIRARAFAVATALAVLGGIFIAPFTLAGGEIGLPIGIKGFAGAVVGGLGRSSGVVLGSLLIGVLESVTAGVLSYGYRDPIAFSLLLLVLLVRPTGLFGRVQERRG